eukprot:scaffold99743_cov24-Prasinocladus_malaysianus.AAC.1
MLVYLENRCNALALGECRCCYEGSPNASYTSLSSQGSWCTVLGGAAQRRCDPTASRLPRPGLNPQSIG